MRSSVGLKDEERKMAPFIYQTLQNAKNKVPQLSPEDLKTWVKTEFEKTGSFQLDYFEIADDTYLQPVQSWNSNIGTMGFIAVFLGNVRLIDNIRFI